MKIGILALQGDFREHSALLKKLGISSMEVRKKQELDEADALIIPGGESTTIIRLLRKSGLDEKIVKRAKQGMPIYGTCAGSIILAKEVVGNKQPSLGLIDVSIERNSYGRQIDSFEADLKIKDFDSPFHAVFIRAPKIKQAGKDVEILAEYNNSPVLLRERNVLISTFHPELTEDTRIHEYFIGIVKEIVST